MLANSIITAQFLFSWRSCDGPFPPEIVKVLCIMARNVLNRTVTVL